MYQGLKQAGASLEWTGTDIPLSEAEKLDIFIMVTPPPHIKSSARKTLHLNSFDVQIFCTVLGTIIKHKTKSISESGSELVLYS